MLWFRYHEGRGYQLTVCADQLELEAVGGALLTSIGLTQSTAVPTGIRHELSVAIADEHATVSVNGAKILQGAVADPDRASGRIVLGLTSSGSKRTAEARFADLDVRAG